ncbi:MAG: 2-oxoacid ferredoxin oxidoreductase [bacterium]|nr:MAG: 2-oxoacid ferredoxin oxidoreductase [bacterium]
MGRNRFDMGGIDIAWCPGCGNFNILETVKETLHAMGLAPEEVVLVSGIGQAAKTPHYLKTHFFNGLHGRALPVATAIKASNPALTVIAESGDGDMYGEGGNHFIHAIRRNPDITNIIHNNMVYGLTKGQASPTSRPGFVTPVQVHGVFEEPFNPLAVALAMNGTFVARAYSEDREQTASVIRRAIEHRGYALVDVLQPCVSFNRVNTRKWYRENSYYLDGSHDTGDRVEAFRVATAPGPFPLGVLYESGGRKTFEENLPAYAGDARPLYQREPDRQRLAALIATRT